MSDAIYRQMKFSDADVVNPENWIPGDDSYNPHKVRPWLLYNEGFILAIVFASNEQDAIDEAVDGDKLDNLQVSQSELKDYVVGKDSEGNDEYEGIAFLGNASEPFDIEGLGIIELPNPPRSFCAQFSEFMKSRKS